MILIGRGLDLGEKGTGESEQGTGEAEAEPGSWERNLDREDDLLEREAKPEEPVRSGQGRRSGNVEASSKGKSWSDGAERKQTCAVLRVRGKGKRERSESEEARSEATRRSAKRSQNAREGKAGAHDPNNPIFPVTIA